MCHFRAVLPFGTSRTWQKAWHKISPPGFWHILRLGGCDLLQKVRHIPLTRANRKAQNLPRKAHGGDLAERPVVVPEFGRQARGFFYGLVFKALGHRCRGLRRLSRLRLEPGWILLAARHSFRSLSDFLPERTARGRLRHGRDRRPIRRCA